MKTGIMTLSMSNGKELVLNVTRKQFDDIKEAISSTKLFTIDGNSGREIILIRTSLIDLVSFVAKE